MAKRVQLIRHLAAAADAFIGKVGELTVNLTANALRVHDGATVGGHEMSRKDASNLQAATAGQDGKMTAAKFAEVVSNTSGLAAHIGTGGVGEHPNATPSVSGFESAADKTKLDTIETAAKDDLTAAEILALLITVDGAGSGLDADLLDGFNASDTVAADTIAKRDVNSRLAAADPATGSHLVTKDWFDDISNAALKARILTAGAGLDGGGDLSADRSFAVNPSTNLSEKPAPGDPADDWLIIRDVSLGVTNKIKAQDLGLPLSREFESSELTLAGSRSASHGLGAIPKLASVSLRCVTANAGYAVGDEVDSTQWQTDADQLNAITQWKTATLVGGSFVGQIIVANKSSGAGTIISNGSWRYVFRAWI